MSESMPGTGPKSAKRTRVHRLGDASTVAAAMSDVAATLKSGGLVIVPTDTVYGIACSAFDPHAVQRVYDLKGRSYSKPLPILISDASLLALVAVDVPPEAALLTGRYWPGPLTLVVMTGPLTVAAAHGRSTIAVRVPDHGFLRESMALAGVPVAATSANQSGEDSIVEGAEAIRQFSGRVDLIIDGGRCPVARESSVVDASRYPFSILREGAVSKKDLERCLRVD